jgi:hypothetical protein
LECEYVLEFVLQYIGSKWQVGVALGLLHETKHDTEMNVVPMIVSKLAGTKMSGTRNAKLEEHEYERRIYESSTLQTKA